MSSFELLDICGDSISVGDIILRAKVIGSSSASLHGYVILSFEETAKTWKVYYSGVYTTKYGGSARIHPDSGYMQFQKAAMVNGSIQSFDVIRVANPEMSLNQKIFQILFEKRLSVMDSLAANLE